MLNTSSGSLIVAKKLSVAIIFKRFVQIFIPLFIIVMLILSAIHYSLGKSLMAKINDEEFLAVNLQKRQIQLEFNSLLSHTLFLAQGEYFNKLYDKSKVINNKVKKEISTEFLLFSQTSQLYDQIRFIDSKGMEIIRINFDDGNPVAIQDKKLQDKRDRYYFKKTFLLKKGHVYISPLDLNIENRTIEIPYKPMIRLGTPVFSQDGTRLGIVIVNYMASRFLSSLAETGQISPGEIMLLNEDSFWLKNKNPDEEWGFMFKNKKAKNFSAKFQSEWYEIQERQNGQIENGNGLFTFQTIYPFVKHKKDLQKLNVIDANKTYWVILSHVPIKHIRAEKMNLLYSFLPVFIFLFILLILGSWIIANISLQKTLKDYELKKANEDLENKVEERTKQLSIINKDLALEIKTHKRTGKKLQKKTNELERSNKELEEFAYIASHDLQEPLRKINSFTKLLEKRYQGSLDEEGDKYLFFIGSATERMKTLIKELLKYSRVSSLKLSPEPVDLNEVLKTCLNDLEMLIKETGAEIFYKALPEIMADKTQMIQLMQNLLCNAIKYQKPGQSENPQIFIEVKEEETRWVVSVKDNGIGIDAAHYKKIFIIFQRLHGRTEFSGTGIGLGVCKKIVERHGGEIWLESEKGKGSTFYFSIKN